jgi:hypothetical protein
MTDLVAEVAEHGPVRLAQLPADALAVRVVGLGEVEGDDAVLVPGARPAGPGWTTGRTPSRRGGVLGSRDDGQRQLVQLEQQPSLGCLGCDEGFGREGVRIGAGSGPGQPAALAQDRRDRRR